LYPNPTINILFVEIMNEAMPAGRQELRIKNELQILDVKGKVVHKSKIDSNKLSIQIEDLAKGVYFVKIGEQTEKFVKD